MSKNLYQILEELLTCPLYFNIFKKPVTPDCCSHVFDETQLNA